MPPRPSFQRPRIATQEAGHKLLIVCEGIATEPKYFEAARISLRLSKGLVQVVHPNATDPKSLVLAAKEEVKGQVWRAGDQAWAIFDGDEHRHDEASRANWDTAIQLARDFDGAGLSRVRLAVSNPCFELWYLLHFQDQNAHLHRDAARRILRTHLSEYEKADVLWDALTPQQRTDAHDRAEVLRLRHERDGREPFTNPSTGVHLLVNTLLAMRRA